MLYTDHDFIRTPWTWAKSPNNMLSVTAAARCKARRVPHWSEQTHTHTYTLSNTHTHAHTRSHFIHRQFKWHVSVSIDNACFVLFCVFCMQCNVGKLCYLGLSVWNNVIQVYQWSKKHAQEWCDKCEGCIPPDSRRKKLYFCECVLYVVWLRTCVSWDTSLAKMGHGSEV